MLMAHPAVLRGLIEEYQAAALRHSEGGGEQARQRMEDAAYTLCVTTGTRDIEAALSAAHHQLTTTTSPDERAPAA